MKTPPLPTMIAGIALGNGGDGGPGHLVEYLGLYGRHHDLFGRRANGAPKVPQLRRPDRPEGKKALYLGYAFLYGVMGSCHRKRLGARLYVHFVDGLDRPAILWLVFSVIGVATMMGLLLYDGFLARDSGGPEAAIRLTTRRTSGGSARSANTSTLDRGSPMDGWAK